MSPHHLGDERRAQAVLLGFDTGLGRVAALHGTLEGVVIHTRTAIGHAQRQLRLLQGHRHLDPRILAVTRVHRIVDQVAQRGDHLLRRQRHVVRVRRQIRVLGDRQGDATLVCLRRLAQQERDECRFADVVRQPVHQALGQGQLVGRESDRVIRLAHLDHGDNGVQLVGRLVRLGAQRVGQDLQRAQFAQRTL